MTEEGGEPKWCETVPVGCVRLPRACLNYGLDTISIPYRRSLEDVELCVGFANDRNNIQRAVIDGGENEASLPSLCLGQLGIGRQQRLHLGQVFPLHGLNDIRRHASTRVSKGRAT